MDAKPTVLYKPQQQQQRADESVTGVEIMAQAEKKQRAVSSDDMNRIFKHWAFAKNPFRDSGQRWVKRDKGSRWEADRDTPRPESIAVAARHAPQRGEAGETLQLHRLELELQLCTAVAARGKQLRPVDDKGFRRVHGRSA